MKKFKFGYSPLALTLLILVAVIFAASVTINVYDAVKFSDYDTTKKTIAIIIATFSLAALVITVAAIVYGRYVVKGKFLYCRFGFIFIKTDISEIFQLTEFKAQNKLVMYFKNGKYSVAVINDKYYNQFYEALKAENPAIKYTLQSAEE